MSDNLPVAACDLCLFYFKQHTEQPWSDGQCRKGSAGAYAYGSHVFSFPLTTEGAWCGEFIHRKLGPQHKMVENYEQDVSSEKMELRFATMVKQWRFPTEEE